MASAKQIAANKRNAQKSTGPKTEEGKEASKFNALKHGMTAETPVLPHESRAAYEETRAALFADFQPASSYEIMLIDQLALAHWRLIRSGRVETGMLDFEIRTLKRINGLDPLEEHKDDACLSLVFSENDEDKFKNWFRYQSLAEQAFYRAGQALHKAQSERLRKQRDLARAAAAPKDDKVHRTPENTVPISPVAPGTRPIDPTAWKEIGFVSSRAQNSTPQGEAA